MALYTRQPSLRARSLAVRGTACRMAGNFTDAQKHYEEARRLYLHLEEQLAEADLYRRWIYLYVDLQRWDEAEDAAERAADIFLAAGDRHSYGRVLLVKATAQICQGAPAAAILLLATALSELDTTKSPEIFYIAVHNLAVAIADSPETTRGQLKEVLSLLRTARRSRRVDGRRLRRIRKHAGRRMSMYDAKLRWVEGLILRRTGDHQTAACWLEQAREDLVALGLPLDVVDVSLDLGGLYAELGCWADFDRLSLEASRILASMPGLGHVAEAFGAWKVAIFAGEETAPMVGTCRRLIATRAKSALRAIKVPNRAKLQRQVVRAIEAAARGCRNLDQLCERLQTQGVVTHYRPGSGTRPPGIAFELQGCRFSGHELGRPYRLPNLEARFGSSSLPSV